MVVARPAGGFERGSITIALTGWERRPRLGPAAGPGDSRRRCYVTNKPSGAAYSCSEAIS
jgi:hypothetical protein